MSNFTFTQLDINQAIAERRIKELEKQEEARQKQQEEFWRREQERRDLLIQHAGIRHILG